VTDAPAFRIFDADNHFNEPEDWSERYIDPAKRDLAIRVVTDGEGRKVQLFAGVPSKFSNAQIVYSKEELDALVGDLPELGGGIGGDSEMTVPGMLLNKLNPLKGVSDEERAQVLAEFRETRESFGNRDLRLALMDDQGIEAAIMFPADAHNIEHEFVDNVEALYANTRAFNRWMFEEVGFNHADRMYLPPYIPLADVELAVHELEIVLGQGAPIVQFKAGHAHGGVDNPHGGRSLADPIFDPIWSRINDSGTKVAIHQGGTDYQKYGADWSENPDVTFGDFDAFQWVMYWADRPAMETVAGLILHSFFGRYPNIKVLMAEQGTVWLPYTIRKCDHAYMMGRRAKWGSLEQRPSEIFREHFFVTPYPEENVHRAIEAVGVEPIVFGSDFPHGEGLARPLDYIDAQLSGLDESTVMAIMRGNLERYLA
jgi:predicted TIM-barrel fold metal-dependent hydrolase